MSIFGRDSGGLFTAEETRASIDLANHYEKLRWQYGPERAHRIMSGQDPADIADRAAWDRCAPRAPKW